MFKNGHGIGYAWFSSTGDGNSWYNLDGNGAAAYHRWLQLTTGDGFGGGFRKDEWFVKND